MDSKLKKRAILASLAVILLVSVLVLYGNRGQDAGATSILPETSNSSAGQAVVNGQILDDLSAFLKDNTFFDE